MLVIIIIIIIGPCGSRLFMWTSKLKAWKIWRKRLDGVTGICMKNVTGIQHYVYKMCKTCVLCNTCDMWQASSITCMRCVKYVYCVTHVTCDRHPALPVWEWTYWQHLLWRLLHSFHWHAQRPTQQIHRQSQRTGFVPLHYITVSTVTLLLHSNITH